VKTIDPDPESKQLTVTDHGVGGYDKAQRGVRRTVDAQVQQRRWSERFDQDDASHDMRFVGCTELDILRPEPDLDPRR
jgi:hypothetical protein